ncbi:uncharacterized protein N7503_000902 [Penicillium pulvis]|uniref:uncharacterized protein n=1 Tax=Penicillium pulvis TaxID=1562058 RepID=UPI0025476C29|nr:uncharacterized protein N7503_000902 [Penicillium pulvis]KAJ5814152.1 hypothetical protein N7503_000902 [Penicillium pulvis]
MNAMESDLQNETIEKEIDKIQTAIQNLDIKILRETHKLDRYKVRKNKRINKFQTRIALKHTQISALAEKQLLSNPTSPFSTSTLASASASASTSLTANAKDKGKSKAKPKHEVEEEDEYTSLLISPNWDTRDPKKLVTWQLERHINWATPNPPWNSRASLHRILDLRTAAELQDGHPPGQGNTMLERKYCRVDPGEDVWGKPAAALLVHVMRAYKDPNGWMLRELPRMLLVKMEGWFFGLSEREREELPGDANDWEGLPEDVAIAWNQALGVGNFIWE